MSVSDFELELGRLLNRTSKEKESDTPEFILAKYLIRCLEAFNEATKDRSQWYGYRYLDSMREEEKE